ncbi:MAG: DUF4360 domain-containing protein [Exilibacterium sp.]
MLKHALLVISSVFWSCMVFAGQTIMINGVPIDITEVNTNGAGCPPDSVTVTTTPDNKQAAVLFNAYRAVTNSTTTVAATDCNIAVGLAVEAGFSVGVVGIDWRGTVVNSGDGFINFHREFFFSGDRGESSDENWLTPGFENFFLEDDPVFVTFSPCDGKPLIARADTSATVVGANSLFTLRSADFESKLLMTLKVVPC